MNNTENNTTTLRSKKEKKFNDLFCLAIAEPSPSFLKKFGNKWIKALAETIIKTQAERPKQSKRG